MLQGSSMIKPIRPAWKQGIRSNDFFSGRNGLGQMTGWLLALDEVSKLLAVQCKLAAARPGMGNDLPVLIDQEQAQTCVRKFCFQEADKPASIEVCVGDNDDCQVTGNCLHSGGIALQRQSESQLAKCNRSHQYG